MIVYDFNTFGTQPTQLELGVLTDMQETPNIFRMQTNTTLEIN
jgi:hypothetical protein